MKRKYNIALIPTEKAQSIIQCADFLSAIADRYLLGINSFPHVTLCQFEANESDIKSIWEKACNEIHQKSIELTFEEFSCISFDEIIFWVSLLPDHRDVLIQMHAVIAGIVNKSIKSNYDPHLTLINTKDSTYENLVDKLTARYAPIQDAFVLALGRSDEIGQLIEVISSCR